MSAEQQPKVARLLPTITPAMFGLAEHRYRRFDVDAPAGVEPGDLENPKLWPHVAGQIRPGDELRITGYGSEWVAWAYVSYVQGTSVRLKVTHGVDLTGSEDFPEDEVRAAYEVKLCGKKLWCIIKLENGEIVKEGIPKKHLAERELDDLIRALKS